MELIIPLTPAGCLLSSFSLLALTRWFQILISNTSQDLDISVAFAGAVEQPTVLGLAQVGKSLSSYERQTNKEKALH